ncbi:MAG: RHS repeat protein [Acidobacteriota bacterium]|nr:RHS repeat protein [Acidobacteriota bacterium]
MKTDRDKHQLRGPVRRVQIEMAQLEEQDGQQVEQRSFGHSYAFDADGRLVEYIARNPDGSTWRTVNDYSDAGQLLATRNFDSSGQPVGGVSYAYDQAGRLIVERVTAPDGTETTPTTYAYDGENRQTKIQTLDVAEEANLMIGIEDTNIAVNAADAGRIETRYDQQGEAVEVKVYSQDGALVSRVEIKRDERGNPLEEIHYTGDVTPFSSCATEETATLTEEQRAELAAEIARLFAPDTAMSKHEHRYDERGRLVESKMEMMGMIAFRQTFAYDEAGNKIEESSFDEDGKLSSKALFTREFDEHGNWTKEIVSTASAWDVEFGLATPVSVTRRIITYYD